MSEPDINSLADRLLKRCRAEGVMLATAESCTGGMIAGTLTEIAGSSDVVERGFVTYCNQAKIDMLGVPPEMLDRYTAVSAETAAAMAEGALSHTPARVTLSIAVTGIAGPGGGNATQPVGLVYVATARRGQPAEVTRHVFPGSRTDVRQATIVAGLTQALATFG